MSFDIFSFAFFVKIINFSLICYVFWFLIKKYIFPSLKNSIKINADSLLNLSNSLSSLQKEFMHSKEMIQLQKEKGEYLLSKVEQWNLKVNNYFEKKIEKSLLQKIKMNDYVINQSNLINLNNIKNNIMPEVIDSVLKDVIVHFKAESCQEAFLNRSIEFLTKEKNV